MNARKNFAITALTLAATLLIAGPAAAQQLEALKANIPFDFYASGKLLPAGTYVISKFGANGAIQLSGPSGSVYVMTAAHTPPSSRGDRLTFRRYGADSFLAGISWSGSAGREIAVNKVERQVALAHARGVSTVAVNAR